MAQGHKQEEGGDNEASSEKPETNSPSNDNEHWIKELVERLKVGSAKNRGHEASSEKAEAQPNTMSPEQIDLAHELCRERVPFTAVGELMGVSEGTVDPFELKRVMMEAEILIAESLSTQGEEEKVHGRFHFQDEVAKFEEYDPVRWEIAAEEAAAPNSLDEIEERVPESPKAAPVVPASKPDFVRALKDSKAGSLLYYKKGDILRVINKTSQRQLDDERINIPNYFLSNLLEKQDER
ncbi:MAG: hypothetical protein Q9161_009424 [Pseudevernia consocians]